VPDLPPVSTVAGDSDVLAAVLRLELEDVLQSVYAARQDVESFAAGGDVEVGPGSADRTLRGCAATLQLLLRFLRAVTADRRGDELMQMMAGPYGILNADHDVLYFNAALRDLLELEHRTLALSRFEDRTWIDRTQMRDHLARATSTGDASMTTTLSLHAGRSIPIQVKTARIDEHPERILLVALRPL
jgi:PAS domain-containing protein